MLTIFAIPKPFIGPTAVIQRNALASWTRLPGGCEVVLCGDEAGVAAAARECGARHLPDIARSPHGTPLVSSAFAQVRRSARHALLCYVNADIILLDDLIHAVAGLRRHRFLLVGQRCDTPLNEPWNFAAPDHNARLRAYAAAHGVLHPPWGSDYFVFARDDLLADLPPFCVGRPGWDNWLIFRARQLGRPVIDGTRAITAIHQRHDYQHVPGGRQGGYHGPEGDAQLALLDGGRRAFTLADTTHMLPAAGRRPQRRYDNLARRWETAPLLHPRLAPVLRWARGWRWRLHHWRRA